MSIRAIGTESDDNALFTANVIANPTLSIDGKTVDASRITPEFLASTLQGPAESRPMWRPANHAIEFLLWGQDLIGTGPGAGNRPYTDYDTEGLHQRPLRPARRLSQGRNRSPGLRLKTMVEAWRRGGRGEQGGGGRSKAASARS